MAKYHINPGTGRVNICRAEIKECPLKGAEHYGTKEEAFSGREKGLSKELGTFSPLKKETKDEPIRAASRTSQVISEYDLTGSHVTPEFISRIAARENLAEDELLSTISARKESEKSELVAAVEKYNIKVDQVIADTPEKLRKGLTVAVVSAGEVRLMKVNSIRGGKLQGETVFDGNVHEPLYLEDVQEHSVLRGGDHIPGRVRPGPFKLSSSWTRVPGEGQFKTIADGEGKSRGSIQRRDGFLYLGARDAKTKRLIPFEKNQFAFEEEAVDYLNDWHSKNPGVELTD